MRNIRFAFPLLAGLVLGVIMFSMAASAAPAGGTTLPPPPPPAPSPYLPPPPPPPADGSPAPPVLAPVGQVQIQVWISETNEQGIRELGANLKYTRVVRGVEQSGTIRQISTNVFSPTNASYTVTLPAPDTTLFPVDPATGRNTLRPDQSGGPANGIQTQSGGGLVANVISPGYGQVDAIFRGIEQKTDIDLVSKPEILVIDNGLAEIHAGSQVPYQNISYASTGAAQLNVTWKDVGVNLKLQPLILNNETVKINITELGVSDVARVDRIRGVDMPVFAMRRQAGEVVVPNGQTLVIGGLASRIIQKNERRVPVVGNIPLLGIPFRGRNTRASNSHLLIFVSPTIVDLRSLTASAQDALAFWKDRRWENSERISKEVEIMQQD